LDGDPAYKRSPSLNRYFYHLTMLITEWERAHQQHLLRTTGRSGAEVPANNQPQSGKGRTSTQTTSVPTGDASISCEGCGRLGHTRPNCSDRLHPDFNENSLWRDSKTREALRQFYIKQGTLRENPTLHRYKRVDGTNINQSVLRRPLTLPLAHRERQPPLPLHQIQVA